MICTLSLLFSYDSYLKTTAEIIQCTARVQTVIFQFDQINALGNIPIVKISLAEKSAILPTVSTTNYFR